MAKRAIGGRLLQRNRIGARVVADEMQMLSTRGGDAERLLHQTIRLVTIAVWPLALRVSGGRPVWRLAARSLGCWLAEVAATALALHLPVGQETARHTTRTPRFAVCPAPHACLSFVPDKHGARFDLLALLLGQASLHARQQTYATSLKEQDSIVGRADVAVVCLHCEVGVKSKAVRRRACSWNTLCEKLQRVYDLMST